VMPLTAGTAATFLLLSAVGSIPAAINSLTAAFLLSLAGYAMVLAGLVVGIRK